VAATPVPIAQDIKQKLQPKSIAIINTSDGGKSSIGNSELNFFADKLREIATEVLPKKDYVATIGKNANAYYICKISIGRFGSDYTIKVELNENESETSIGFFTDNSKDMHGLLSIINEKAPIMFKKLLPEQIIATPVVTPVTAATQATPASTAAVAPTVSPAPWLASTTATPAAKTAYTGSNKCYKEIFDLPKNDMQNFIKDLGISVAKVQVSCKTKWTCPADDKITDVGLTAGCVKQLPMDPNGILTMLKDIGLDVGANLAPNLAAESPTKINTNINGVDKGKDNSFFWAALTLDAVGISFIAIAKSKNRATERLHYEYMHLPPGTSRYAFDSKWKEIDEARRTRNVLYIVGGLFLATGIGVHIWF